MLLTGCTFDLTNLRRPHRSRFLEGSYWSLEHEGKRVVDTITEAIAWRELLGVHKIRKEDVADYGTNGAILVKGHDLQRQATAPTAASKSFYVALQYSTVSMFREILSFKVSREMEPFCRTREVLRIGRVGRSVRRCASSN